MTVVVTLEIEELPLQIRGCPEERPVQTFTPNVEVWTAGGLTRFAVLFMIHLATRRLEIAGILPKPDSAWVIQGGRQLTDPVDGCLRGKRFLLHDRDPRFTDASGDTLAAAGVETLRLPPRSPNLNARRRLREDD